MQNIHDLVASARTEKKKEAMVAASSSTSGSGGGGGGSSDIVKKLRSGISHPRDIECLIPGVVSDRDQHVPLSPNQADTNVKTCHIIADKYVLLDNVEGSSLCRCVDVKTQEELVCKVVSHESHSLLSAHYRLESHPRISSLHEVIVGNRYLYLVFPRAYGDLHSYVRSRKRLRESEARRLFRQIVETVQVCHRNGIVLRDLKLRKFVFADAQRTELKLESLEDAVVLEEPESDWLHDKRGCPAYVSPEILKVGANYSGKAADMWSLGVILYTMLVGRINSRVDVSLLYVDNFFKINNIEDEYLYSISFNDSDHSVLFAKISRGHFVIPDCLSPRARCLIRSLLRREPAERLTSDDILYHPWLAKEDKDWQSRSCDQMVPECRLFDDED